MPDENLNLKHIDTIYALKERINESLKDKIKSNSNISDETQVEIGKLANLLGEIEQLALKLKGRKLTKWQKLVDKFYIDTEKPSEYLKIKEEQLYSMIKDVDLAANAVCKESPNLHASRNIRRRIEYQVRWKKNFLWAIPINVFKQFLHWSSSPGKVFLGLLLGLPFYIGVPLICVKNVSFIATTTYLETPKPGIDFDIDKYKQNISLIILAGSAGALGSFISIITRIKQYDSKEYEDAVLPITIGALKPIIGAAFGILIVTLISSNTLPLQVDEQTPGRKQYFFYSIAFIIGFSERFARDIVSRAERAIIGRETDVEASNINQDSK